MANYNYTTVEQILGTLEGAFLTPNVELEIESSRGNVVRVELAEWVAECGPREGETVRTLFYRGENCGGSMNFDTAMDRAYAVARVLLALDARLKVGKKYLRYRDMILVNAPKHPLYGHIIDAETLEVIY